MDDQDEGAKVGLWVVLGIITLLLFGLIGGLGLRATNAHHAAKPLVAAQADAMIDAPLSGDIVARVFFELGKADVQAGNEAALASATHALSEAPSKKLLIAGFHDPSGDPARNAELAKQRAKAVRAGLVANGADAARLLLRKPEQTALGGPAEEARRVEVRLVD